MGTADAHMSKATECKTARVIHNREYRQEMKRRQQSRLICDKCVTGFWQWERRYAHMEIRGRWKRKLCIFCSAL